MRKVFLTLLLPFATCAMPGPPVQPAQVAQADLAAAQTRLVAEEPDQAMIAVLATLHDLGYRIVAVDPRSGTVWGTRDIWMFVQDACPHCAAPPDRPPHTGLEYQSLDKETVRIAVSVQPAPPTRTLLRANAVIVERDRMAQIGAAGFYAENFFAPLAGRLHQPLAPLPAGTQAPALAWPRIEVLSAKMRRQASDISAEDWPLAKN